MLIVLNSALKNIFIVSIHTLLNWIPFILISAATIIQLVDWQKKATILIDKWIVLNPFFKCQNSLFPASQILIFAVFMSILLWLTEYIWVADCWWDKARLLKMATWALGNYNGHFSDITQMINRENNEQIYQ